MFLNGKFFTAYFERYVWFPKLLPTEVIEKNKSNPSFTVWQRAQLIREFRRSPFIPNSRKEDLHAQLGLSMKQIGQWFQRYFYKIRFLSAQITWRGKLRYFFPNLLVHRTSFILQYLHLHSLSTVYANLLANMNAHTNKPTTVTHYLFLTQAFLCNFDHVYIEINHLYMSITQTFGRGVCKNTHTSKCVLSKGFSLLPSINLVPIIDIAY